MWSHNRCGHAVWKDRNIGCSLLTWEDGKIAHCFFSHNDARCPVDAAIDAATAKARELDEEVEA